MKLCRVRGDAVVVGLVDVVVVVDFPNNGSMPPTE